MNKEENELNLDGLNFQDYEESDDEEEEETVENLIADNLNFEDENYNELKINLGSDDLPRYNCGNHKLDIVGRKAVSSHRIVSNIIRKLNKSSAHVKRVIKLSKAFRKKKCRLRLIGKSRWSTAYLLLLSVKKAYDKGLFSEANPCSVRKETVELYLKILKPIYLLNVQWQSNHSSIGEVIPGKVKFFLNFFKALLIFFPLKKIRYSQAN